MRFQRNSGIGCGYTLDLNGNRFTIAGNDGSMPANVYDNENRPNSQTGIEVSPHSRG